MERKNEYRGGKPIAYRDRHTSDKKFAKRATAIVSSKIFLSFILSFALLLPTIAILTAGRVQAQGGEYYLSSAWKMGPEVVTDYATGDGPRAYNTATTTLQDDQGTVNVTASFYSLPERSNPALEHGGANPSYLTDTGNNQSSYGATAEMFYGKPDPATVPALGVYVQPGFGEGGNSGTWNKFNFDGKAEAGTLKFTFDRAVTNPIIDVSGIGGLVTAWGYQQTQFGPAVVGLGSFNATSFRLVTPGITMGLDDGASNLRVEGNTLDIINRNTHTRSVPTNSNNFRKMADGKYRWFSGNNQYQFYSPSVEGAGTGSIILQGTFTEVEFKLDHEATPFSHFSANEYGTSPYYFTNFSQQLGNAYGDGINGLNVNKTETIQLCNQYLSGMQNSDLFRLSIRLPKTYKVTYEYKSGTEGMDLPAELKAKAPAEVPGKVKGDMVTSPVPTGKDAEFRDEANRGTWKFQAYDRADVTITNKNEHVVGTWVFEKDQAPATYKVTHEFRVAADSSISTFPAEVQAEVNKQLPETQSGKQDGEVVKPGALQNPLDVEDTANDGHWTFKAFLDQDPATQDVDAKINKADVNFVGEWTFVPNEHKVTYEYKSGTEGMDLPAELKAKAPDEVPGKVKGDTVTSPVPTGKDAEFRDEANQGTWKFQAYDRAEVTITNKNEHVVGTWVFEKDQAPATYKVTHKFKSADPNRELPKEVEDLLPANQTGKADGSKVMPTAPGETSVQVPDGTWTFEGYDKPEKTVEGKDVEFIGIWKFTPKTPDPEPTVHTKFVEEGTEKELAPQETGAQPKKAIEGYVYVKTVKDDAGNVTHIYKKVNVPTPQPTVHTSYIEEGTEKVLSPQEAGAQPKKAIEGYVFVKTVKDDAGNLTHIYKKVAVPAPKPSVHTNYVEEKTNKVISPQESGDKPKKAIDGYVFVKTTKDKKGNVTHIYKKVASANKKGKAPKTGDRFIAGYAAMAVLSMTTLSAMVMIGKKKETSEK